MKKFLSILLVTLLALSCFALAGCSGDETTSTPSEDKYKFGMGLFTGFGTIKNADGDVNGNATVTTTAAAVILDKDGKVVKCAIDTVDAKVEYTANGELVAPTEYKTKGELGTDYGMSSIGKTEWNVQVENLCKFAEGKTLTEIKAWVATDGKGTSDVQSAGCTITIADFVLALEKAISSAVESDVKADNTLSIGFVTKQEKGANATDDKDGSVNVVSNIVAAAVSGGKAVATVTDCVDVKISFNVNGESMTDINSDLTSKRNLGTAYNMSAFGQDLNGDGVVKEWNEQADVLDSIYKGKTADEIAALVAEGYGVESVQTAGCTIAISDLVAAAVKAVK